MGEKCYVLSCRCYSGDNSTMVFWKLEDARKCMVNEFIIEEINLKESGYKYKYGIGVDECSLYTTDSDIYFDWCIVETEIQ